MVPYCIKTESSWKIVLVDNEWVWNGNKRTADSLYLLIILFICLYKWKTNSCQCTLYLIWKKNILFRPEWTQKNSKKHGRKNTLKILEITLRNTWTWNRPQTKAENKYDQLNRKHQIITSSWRMLNVNKKLKQLVSDQNERTNKKCSAINYRNGFCNNSSQHFSRFWRSFTTLYSYINLNRKETYSKSCRSGQKNLYKFSFLVAQIGLLELRRLQIFSS